MTQPIRVPSAAPVQGRGGRLSRRDLLRRGQHAAPAGVQDEILQLVNRTTQGFTEAAYAEASTLGYDGWIEFQLDHLNIPDAELDAILASLPTLTMTGAQLFQNYGPGSNQVVPVQQLRAAALIRSTLSRRQLFERMVEFWTDHFNILQGQSLATRLLKTVDDREVIRTHALGSFPEMVHASAKSGAMIDYLDTFANVVGSPNENYSRELMELHTFGVDGPYNEQDVQELARCFTGWRFRRNAAVWGEFLFAAPFHDFGEKNLLGTTIPAGGGVTDAETVIDLLVMHTATATFVSRKMINWVLGYDPPQALVDQTAAVYLSTSGDIKEMLRFILRRNHVMAGVPWDKRKHKRPFAYLVGLIRQTQPTIGNIQALAQQLNLMGQIPFNWGPPDGYPDTIEAWGAAVLPRWTLASRLLDNQLPQVVVTNATLQTLMKGIPSTQWATRINEFMAGGALTPSEVADVQAYVDAGTPSGALVREAIALVASSPSYQYY
ncbi:MAG: DUF1800 domain-containing protein [bacterium]|nr:DUF1800 domain-containing protein [bacterium]